MASETSSIEKSESRAVVETRSESPATSVKSASSSGKKSKKTKVKAVVAAVAATQELVEEETISNLSGDHPYLSVLYKRIRSHRKKLEKIKTLEQAKVTKGKVLNAQQLELMSNKAPLEKLVVELEMLREQFLTVFKQEQEQKKQSEAEAAAAVAVAEEQQEQAVDKEIEEKDEVQEQVEKEVVEKVEEQVEEEQVDEFVHVFELLKTLHVVNLHQALGKEVPMVLDFFSKVLLGNTRPPAELSYEENLMESLEEAKKYLTDSDKVFACDTSYSGLRAFVDQLANISSPKVEEQDEVVEEEVQEEFIETEEAEVEEPSDIPVVPAEINTMPEISFFTESQLEKEQADEFVGEAVELVDVAEPRKEATEVVAAEVQADEIIEQGEIVVEEQVLVEAPPAPASIPSPPLSFAAVAASGAQNDHTPSPSASSDPSAQDGENNSPRDKNSQRRRGQGRWREKGSNSNTGNKSGNGSPTNGGKPRRPRGPRTNDENSAAQGGKRSGSKEGRRPRVDRALRKQGNPSQQPATPMIAPHA